jgi:hypothetical protein
MNQDVYTTIAAYRSEVEECWNEFRWHKHGNSRQKILTARSISAHKIPEYESAHCVGSRKTRGPTMTAYLI